MKCRSNLSPYPVLRLDPADVDARQTRLFLLLQTEQYDAALSFIDSDGNGGNHAYQRTYSLYRLQNEHEARKVLNDIKGEKVDGDRGLMHLEAQLVRVPHHHDYAPSR